MTDTIGNSVVHETAEKLDALNVEEGEGINAIDGIEFINYEDESRLESVMRLVGRDLSEPYSVFTYRYFLQRFPELCILAVPKDSQDGEPIGCVVCKIDDEDDDGCKDLQNESTVNNDPLIVKGSSVTRQRKVQTGYIAMLAVDTTYRRSGIGSALVQRAVTRMKNMGVQSVTLETEVKNKAAMKLYEERFGFVREELLVRYYLNWGDAYRLRLWLEMSNGLSN